MDIKKAIIVIVIFICLITCLCVVGYAAVVASDATVISAGPYNSGSSSLTVFSLKVGTSTTAKYFKSPPGREKEMLAVAIAAMTGSRKIRVYKDTTSLGGSTPASATVIIGMELK